MAEAAPPAVSGLGRVKKVWLILSGKGGVGKSTMSAQLAVTLAASGCKVSSPPPHLLLFVSCLDKIRAFSWRALVDVPSGGMISKAGD